MKLVVLLPNAQWLDRAGVRIRYRRIERHIDRFGWSMEVKPIGDGEFTDAPGQTFYLLSKIHDARALAFARTARRRGSRVGLDLFDDYFSQSLARTYSNRNWLKRMAGEVDFMLCSTGRMRGVAHRHAPDMPVHVVNDPFASLDRDPISRALAAKQARTLAERHIRIVWFGNGANPVFPVGLSDLAGFGEALRPLASCGFSASLRVLTDAGAIGYEALAALRRLPVEFTIEDWSIEAEAAALTESTIAFLPVNYQDFSIAKSLNRGISALTTGTQIFSVGFDLYSSLAPLVYRDPDEIVADLMKSRLRLRVDTVDLLCDRMHELADPEIEAQALAGFLSDLAASPQQRVPAAAKGPLAIVHGVSSPSFVHALAEKLGWWSLSTPLQPGVRAADIHVAFDDRGAGFAIRVAERASRSIVPEHRASIVRYARPDRKGFVGELPVPAAMANGVLGKLRREHFADRAQRVVRARETMTACLALFEELLGGIEAIVSDQEYPMMAMYPAIASSALGGR